MKKVTTLLFAVVIIAGCEKKSSNNNSSSSTQSATTTSGTTTGGTTTGGTPGQASGVMHVANAQGSGSAVAYFRNANGVVIDVGTVKINDILVPINAGLSYVLGSNFQFSSQPVWKISGANGFPMATIIGKSVPYYPNITGNDTIYETQPFTFTNTPASCDSILYSFGSYTLMTGGTNTSITIPAITVVTTNTWDATVGASMSLYNYTLQTVGTTPCRIMSSYRVNTNFPYKQ